MVDDPEEKEGEPEITRPCECDGWRCTREIAISMADYDQLDAKGDGPFFIIHRECIGSVSGRFTIVEDRSAYVIAVRIA